jgi:hypothetical protein
MVLSREVLVQMLMAWYLVSRPWVPSDSKFTDTLLEGTSLICAVLEIGLSFLPPRVLRRIFPPMVTGMISTWHRTSQLTYLSGIFILMIGSTLVGSSGIADWGGGSNGCQTRPTSGIYQLCPTVGSPHALPYV